MVKPTKSRHYLAPCVLIGLHYHKVGQYRSLERVTALTTAILVVVIALAISSGDDGKGKDQVYRVTPPLVDRLFRSPSSPSDFSIGYIGPTRTVSDHGSVFAPEDLPESGLVCPHSHSAPGVFAYPHQVDSAVTPLSTDYDFGLPGPPPLWRFTERGLPAGIVHDDITLSRLPHAVLASPAWPARVWLVDDTAVVEGLLTFHAYGLLSFELVSESHPGRAFGAAVQEAIYQSTCFPALDNSGNRITVSCPYRCLFVQGAQSSVSVGASVTAIIKKD